MKNIFAIAAKAKKVHELWEGFAAPLKIYENIKQNEDGSATYIFQAQFQNSKDAENFKAFCQLSKELEDMMRK